MTEAEKLYGLKADQTAAPGVSPLERIRCISAGWDINIVKMLFGTIFRGNDASQPSPSGIATTTQEIPFLVADEDKFSYSAAMRLSLDELLTKEGCIIHQDENYVIFPGGEQVMIYFNRNEVWNWPDGPGYLCDESRIWN